MRGVFIMTFLSKMQEWGERISDAVRFVVRKSVCPAKRTEEEKYDG